MRPIWNAPSFACAAMLFAACLMLLPGHKYARAEEVAPQPAERKEQTLLVGPFSLGDFYAKANFHQRLIEEYGERNVPAKDDILKELNRCRFYVRDRSVVRENGSWGFLFVEDEEDRQLEVLVSGYRGSLQFAVSDPEGKSWTIQISEAVVGDSHTEVFDDSSESWRRLRFIMGLTIEAPAERGGAVVHWSISGGNFAVTYDVHGKQTDPDLKPGQPAVR